MVRATFVYVDFPGTGASPPTFNLEIQAQLAGTVSFTSSIVSYFETYLLTTSDSIFVCLARITPTSTTTGGIPFITSLELRALDTASMYSAIVQQGLSMYNLLRTNVGATSDQEIRYIIKSSSSIQHITPSYYKLQYFLSLSCSPCVIFIATEKIIQGHRNFHSESWSWPSKQHKNFFWQNIQEHRTFHCQRWP
jgi:hypothetical protein